MEQTTVEAELTASQKLQLKLSLESASGILPCTNQRYFEQSNRILRSAVFAAVKRGEMYPEWTELFSFGKGGIFFKGMGLTTEHEEVLAQLLLRARGSSLMKPVQIYQADLVRSLKLSVGGSAFKKVRKLLDELSTCEIRIRDQQALARLYVLLTESKEHAHPETIKYVQHLKDLYEGIVDMIKDGLAKGEATDISLRFIQRQTHNSKTGRILIHLDPITALFFDGANTTLLPFETWVSLCMLGRKLLPFIASHRDGVFPIKLETYHEFTGMRGDFTKNKRKIKFEYKRLFTEWEGKGWIMPGWKIAPNLDGDEIVSGLKIGDELRIRSKQQLAAFAEGADDFADDLLPDRPDEELHPQGALEI